MTQVKIFVGSEHDVQELASALIQLGIHALAYNPIAPSRWGVFVPEEQADEAETLIRALDDTQVLAGRWRGRDPVIVPGVQIEKSDIQHEAEGGK